MLMNFQPELARFFWLCGIALVHVSLIKLAPTSLSLWGTAVGTRLVACERTPVACDTYTPYISDAFMTKTVCIILESYRLLGVSVIEVRANTVWSDCVSEVGKRNNAFGNVMVAYSPAYGGLQAFLRLKSTVDRMVAADCL